MVLSSLCLGKSKISLAYKVGTNVMKKADSDRERYIKQVLSAVDAGVTDIIEMESLNPKRMGKLQSTDKFVKNNLWDKITDKMQETNFTFWQ